MNLKRLVLYEVMLLIGLALYFPGLFARGLGSWITFVAGLVLFGIGGIRTAIEIEHRGGWTGELLERRLVAATLLLPYLTVFISLVSLVVSAIVFRPSKLGFGYGVVFFLYYTGFSVFLLYRARKHKAAWESFLQRFGAPVATPTN